MMRERNELRETSMSVEGMKTSMSVEGMETSRGLKLQGEGYP